MGLGCIPWFCLLLVGRLFLHGSVFFCFDCFCGFRQSRFCGFAGALAGTAPALALGEFCRRAGCCSVFSRNFCLCRCVFQAGCLWRLLRGCPRCCRAGEWPEPMLSWAPWILRGQAAAGLPPAVCSALSLWGLCSRSCRFLAAFVSGCAFSCLDGLSSLSCFCCGCCFRLLARCLSAVLFALAAAGGFVVVACAVAGFLFGLCNGALVQILSA